MKIIVARCLLLSLIVTTQSFAADLTSVTGFGMNTHGGMAAPDMRILKVVNTHSDGEGSLRWALAQKGPRLVIFEVGGVVNLAKDGITISEPFVTIAGETAPKPGITLIRGGITVRTHDVQIRHLMVRPGDNNEKRRSGWESDGISVSGADAYDVHIDHCSLTWAIDENASASGPRDKGHDATSKRITFSNSIIAEGLDNSTHIKGKHSKGLLVHDYVRDVAIVGNLFAHNDRRNPYFKGHTNGVVVNNLLYDIGNAAVQLGYVDDEYAISGLTPANPIVSVVGNVLIYGTDSYSDLPLVAYQGDAFLEDNQVINLRNLPMPQVYGDVKRLTTRTRWPEGLTPIASSDVEKSVLKNVGARPWQRDPIDQRIINSVIKRTGGIINSQNDVGGYPRYKTTHRTLNPPTTELDKWLAQFSIVD